MKSHEPNSILTIDPVEHREAWLNIWSCQKFFNWTDAHEWLNTRYGAVANKQEKGFDIKFQTREDLAQFVLEWL